MNYYIFRFAWKKVKNEANFNYLCKVRPTGKAILKMCVVQFCNYCRE